MAESDKTYCANCNTDLSGEYCSFCGQKHHAHKETFGELVYEFFSDFTHFDSRFFRCVIPLLFRPGILTINYIAGKRASQFHPIRLYLFSSFIYFFLIFSFSKMNEESIMKQPVINIQKSDPLNNTGGNENRNNFSVGTGQGINFISSDSTENKVDIKLFGIDTLISNGVTMERYNHIQDSLPTYQKDHFFKRYFIRQSLKLYEEGKKDGVGLLRKIMVHVVHNIPKMLFFLLPIFALLLKLLYIRRKKFYFLDHAVFSLHYFSFAFILLSIAQFVLDGILKTSYLGGFAIVWILVYLFIAMKRIYGQGAFKTLIKYILLGLSFTSMIVIALIVNFIVSAIFA
ncbi:MAG: DUF3667 domain-containing protein [Bacteroidota bacterium]